MKRCVDVFGASQQVQHGVISDHVRLWPLRLHGLENKLCDVVLTHHTQEVQKRIVRHTNIAANVLRHPFGILVDPPARNLIKRIKRQVGQRL